MSFPARSGRSASKKNFNNDIYFIMIGDIVLFLSKLLYKPIEIIGSKKNMASISSITIATFFNSFVGFVVSLLAARVLGVESFGLFALSITIINMVSVFGEFGIDLTLMRLYNKYQGVVEKQKLLLNTIFQFKLLLFTLIIFLSVPISIILINTLQLKIDNLLLFIMSFVSAGLFLFWNYLISLFKATRKFTQVAAYTFSYGGLRLTFMLMSFFLLPHSPLIWLLATYTIPNLIVTLFGIFNINICWYKARQSKNYLGMLKEILGYSKWVAISSISYNYILGSVRFILAYLSTTTAVGVFSAGILFTLAFSVFNQSIRAILFPYVTALLDQEKIDQYLVKIKKMTPYYLFVSVLGIIGLSFFQWLFLGIEYQKALPVFLITSISLAVTIFMGFKTMLAHTYMNPEIFAYVNLGRLISTVTLAYILIPMYNEIGAALSYAIPLIFGELYLCKHVNFLIQQKTFISEKVESADRLIF